MNEYHHITRILSELKEIMQREDKRHLMDQHLTPSMCSLLQSEIIPLIENELDYDPTDDMAGEPPITMDEMYKKAVAEKRIAWS